VVDENRRAWSDVRNRERTGLLNEKSWAHAVSKREERYRNDEYEDEYSANDRGVPVFLEKCD
jgi:hypothetical protein